MTTKTEVPTFLIRSTMLGYIHLVYYQNSNGMYEAYIRMYNFYNHYHSKLSREARIGVVED